MSVAEQMTKLTDRFQADQAAGLEATIQLVFTGAEAEQWFVTIHQGTCTIAPGTAPAPRLTLTADSGDIFKILSGQMNAMAAFMQGRLRLAGDMNLAQRLVSIFSRKVEGG